MDIRSRTRNNGLMSRAKLGVPSWVVMIMLLSRLYELLHESEALASALPVAYLATDASPRDSLGRAGHKRGHSANGADDEGEAARHQRRRPVMVLSRAGGHATISLMAITSVLVGTMCRYLEWAAQKRRA